MSTRTVIFGESAENIHLKKEIELLSKMIKDHQAQQCQRNLWPGHSTTPKAAGSRTVVFTPKRASPSGYNPNSFKPTTYPKVNVNRTRTHFVKRSQPQMTQQSKYKLIKQQPVPSPVSKSATKNVFTRKRPFLQQSVLSKSIQLASHQPNVFSKTQRNSYKFVNRMLTPKRIVQRSPLKIIYPKPYSIRRFKRLQKYSFRSAFHHASYISSPWNRIPYRLYPQPAITYKLKTNKKGRNCTGKSQVVSIGGVWYRASQTKLSRTSTPVNRKVLYRSGSPRLITVMGVKYQMDAKGTVLKRISPKAGVTVPTTPKSRIDVGGHTYVKNATGVFVKTPTTEKRIFASRAINRSIYHIQRSHQRKAWRKNNQHCMFYVRFGKCHKGSKCQYVHDPEKVAVCTRFLRGTCKVSQCPFSHKISPDKMPVCSYFLQGRCSSDNCPYRHVKVNPSAGICKNFLKGHCPQGTKCKERHVMDCPDLKKGSCSKKDCPFRHRKRKINTTGGAKDAKRKLLEKPQSEGLKTTDVGSLPSFIALPSISPEINPKCQRESGKSQLQIRPRFLKMN